MPTEVILPRVDMDMTEGMIAAWHVSEGDAVREGTLIFEIETSKATMEIDAPASGVIRQISAPVGKTVPVGTAVAWIYANGEALQAHGGTEDSSSTQSEAEVLSEHVPAIASATAASPGGPLRATPAARRVARERGLQLVAIAGSGPHGRIGAQDVLRAPADRTATRSDATTQAAHALHTLWLRKDTSRTPLVLLHGFAAELNSWRPFSRSLGGIVDPGIGMLAIDLPAHGKSSCEATGSLAAIVSAVEETLLAEGVGDCHLVGHSFGGAIALAVAASQARVRAKSLTLIAPAGLGPECNGAFIRGVTQSTQRASLAAWLKQLFADPSLMDEAFVATAQQQLESAEVRERLAHLADVFFPDGTQGLDMRAALERVSADVPVRVVWGLQDRVLPARHAEGLTGRIAVHRFAGAGHLPQVEAQDDVARIVAENVASAMGESVMRRGAVG
ncbi:acetoin dehydrogenase dihydrolipoyllysine-residue acetyltransferase subunit [Paraburkholderia saeva]|uniref:2-succinyl-6-hydroxy-2, 4-cyclohexadiene-1-carboxylate synthase n=1 Tax=Paraburkholderia saeva TaxID=2777537 RepID=A0A9N8RU86_9BURK|nr:acetoin dehydrogenase dihydrolipoyllysine-residue acetyltransferase subunit [Paraburkholderia saeva]CAG4890089.1 2-succinyl-6-hydroxy-2, 4-cyclohexadiene-1-carboxylate synthase [Paraburkholderia saeva]CAG4925075.1 2-succinyl-6-hydroxy-2, 4-cyclohexadiene-1-carboxylate synthase [Paraburkholderia saeva]